MHYQSVNPCRVLSSPSFSLSSSLLSSLVLSSSLSSSLLSLSVFSLSLSPCGVVVVLLSCGVVCCVMCDVCYHLVVFGNGFPSRFVHFSFVASFSCMACGTEAGRQSPVRQTELIIGIRDVHNEVSAWASRTTLRWWTASKTTCSTAEVSVRHLAGEMLQGVVAAVRERR